MASTTTMPSVSPLSETTPNKKPRKYNPRPPKVSQIDTDKMTQNTKNTPNIFVQHQKHIQSLEARIKDLESELLSTRQANHHLSQTLSGLRHNMPPGTGSNSTESNIQNDVTNNININILNNNHLVSQEFVEECVENADVESLGFISTLLACIAEAKNEEARKRNEEPQSFSF